MEMPRIRLDDNKGST